MRTFAFTLIAASLPGVAHAGVYTTNITELMRGAIDGQNVNTAVPGASLLLMKNGQVIYHQAFGISFVNEIHQADSATKTLSAAAVMAAVDQSVLPFSLDTTLATYIPGFNQSPAKAAITVRQAFSHSSGLPGSETSQALTNPNITLQESAAIIADLPQVFGPAGSTFAYGGVSMQAAGAAAEVATGVPFAQLLENRILDPLGMSNTSFTLASQTNPRVGGGAASSARDFGRLMEMLRTGGLTPGGQRVLSQSSVEQIFTRQTDLNIDVANSPLGNADYGIGVWLDRRDAQGNLTQALAAGARGFSSWIDFPNGVTGVLATDTTSAQNVYPFLNLVRDEIALQVNTFTRDGDADLSGSVNLDDFTALAGNFGRGQKVWEEGDFNGDGFVTLNDFTRLAANFGQTAPAARNSVPEPTAAALAGLLGGLLIRHRR